MRGVAKLFVNQFNGRKIVGTVGQLQFEVIQYRLLHEYNAQCKWEPINLYKACWIESDDKEELENFKNGNTIHGKGQRKQRCFSCRFRVYVANGSK